MKLITCISTKPTSPTEALSEGGKPANTLFAERESSRQSTVFSRQFAIFIGQVISQWYISIFGIAAHSKKRHYEPQALKLQKSRTLKTRKYFTIKKGGEVNPINMRIICKQQQQNKKREHAKYKLERPFKLQFW